MGEAKAEYGEPWEIEQQYAWSCGDGRGIHVYVYVPVTDPVEQQTNITERLVALMNLVAGVPDTRLLTSDPAVCMFVAYLKGDDAAAASYAEEVMARSNAGNDYVPRAELEKDNAATKGQLGQLRKLLRHVRSVIVRPHIVPPDPPYRGSDDRWQNERNTAHVVYLFGVIHDVLERINKVVAHGRGAEPAEVPGDA